MKNWKQKVKEDWERGITPYIPLVVSNNKFKCPECKMTGTCKPVKCNTKAFYDQRDKKD